MTAVAGTASFTLAIIFAWSGFAKARRPTLAATAIRDFGLTRRLHVRLGMFLGLAELALAVLLASTAVLEVSLAISAVVLWAFSGLLARALTRGDSFPCFCFGEADSSISRLALARTLLLATLASLVTAMVVLRSDERLGLEGTLLQATIASAVVATLVLAAKTVALVRSSPATLHAG